MLETWPLTIGHIGNDECHSTTVGPKSTSTASSNCCNLAYDNCGATPKFVKVNNEYTPEDAASPVEASDAVDGNSMGCSLDGDNDGVHDGKDRCAYSTEIEVDYVKGVDPEGNTVDVSNLITIDSFGCVVTLPPAWDINFVDVTANTEDDADGSPLSDADGDANPDVQVLFTTPRLLWDVQGSRGVSLPPTLAEILAGGDTPALANTYDSGKGNELIKATVYDYTCTKKFDDSTTLTGPTSRLLPTAVIRGVGKFPEDANNNLDVAGDKNIPEGSQPFIVDIELNPDGIVGSEVWKIDPPFDEASVEFCLRVDLFSDMEQSVNFIELKTRLIIDLTQGFKVSGTEVKRNEATTDETQIDIQYDLNACHCQGEDADYACVADSTNPDNDEFVKQDEAMNVCVRFDDPTAVPAYVRMTDLKMFSCSQGTLSYTPILDFIRAQDGTTAVDIFDNFAGNVGQTGANDRMVVVSANLPSGFFGTEASTVDCEGTLVYDFTQGANIGRRTAEASIPTIAASPAATEGERKLNDAEEKFSVQVPLSAATVAESSSMNAGLVAGVSVAAVLGAVAVGLLVVKNVPAVRVSKMTDSRRPSLDTDHSISDNSPNHYIDNDKGYVA
jgi:hypothetical protein